MNAVEVPAATEQVAADVALNALGLSSPLTRGGRMARAIGVAVRAIGEAGLLMSTATAMAEHHAGYARALATVRALAEQVSDADSLLVLLDSLASGAEAMVYRAEHGSTPLGWYLTPAAAREHCEDLVRRERWEWDTRLRLDWIPDTHDVDSVVGLSVWDASAPAEQPVDTGYSVTPLLVSPQYDPDADE